MRFDRKRRKTTKKQQKLQINLKDGGHCYVSNHFTYSTLRSYMENNKSVDCGGGKGTQYAMNVFEFPPSFATKKIKIQKKNEKN